MFLAWCNDTLWVVVPAAGQILSRFSLFHSQNYSTTSFFSLWSGSSVPPLASPLCSRPQDLDTGFWTCWASVTAGIQKVPSLPLSLYEFQSLHPFQKATIWKKGTESRRHAECCGASPPPLHKIFLLKNLKFGELTLKSEPAGTLITLKIRREVEMILPP